MLHPEHLFDVLAPSLPGALCRDEYELFDATIASPTGYRSAALSSARTQALALCHRCPALSACRAPYDALPPRQRPAGVIAGQVSSHRPPGYQRLASA